MAVTVSPIEALDLQLSEGRCVILDGGVGTELQRRGVPMDDIAWCGLAALNHPQILQEIHEDYVRAGADVLIANTFACGRHILAQAGRGEDAPRAFEASVEAARRAVEASEAPRAVAIAGSLSTMLVSLPAADGSRATQPLEPADADRVFSEGAKALAGAGCDVLVIEMARDLEVAGRALEAALETELPVWLGFSVKRDADGRLTSYRAGGPLFDTMIEHFEGHGASVMGVMHSSIDDTEAALPVLRASWDGPVMAYPESGHFKMPEWQFVDIIEPEAFAERVAPWSRSGVSMLGGCCGLDPEHIAALARRLRP